MSKIPKHKIDHGQIVFLIGQFSGQKAWSALLTLVLMIAERKAVTETGTIAQDTRFNINHVLGTIYV